MTALNDRIGQRYGTLTVQRREPNNEYGRPMWQCFCDCGATIIVPSNNLQSGNTKSCGCQKPAAVANARFKHGHAHSRLGGTPSSREYNSWASMTARCTNENNPKFPIYGGRGIAICDRWRNGADGLSGFECFLADMGTRPPDTSIDRYPDNDGNYEPTNCRWATPKQQANNKGRQSADQHVD